MTPSFRHITIAVVPFLFLLSHVTCFRILLLPLNMISRYSSYGPLAQALLRKGHNVTMVIGAKMSVPDHLVNSGMEFRFYDMVSETRDLGTRVYESALSPDGPCPAEVVAQAVAGMEEELEQIFLDAELLDQLAGGMYDFAVTDPADILRVVAYRLGVPYGVLGTECPWWDMTIPYNPTHVPHHATHFMEVMNLKDRAKNLLAYLYDSPLFTDNGLEKVRAYAGQRPAVTYSKLRANISLCLRVREVVTDTYRGLPPNVINVGRMLTRRARPLPDNLMTFVGGATDGFVVVSFGTWFDEYPRMVIHNFLEAFARLRKVRVIWRFTVPAVWTFRLPDNVRTYEWLPQNDLLAHPKCRLFVSHLGIHGLTESVYHGVPVLGFPMALDQHANAAVVRTHRYGVTLDIHRFNDLKLYKTMRRVMDGNYGEHAKRASAVLKHLPPGGDAAVRWIEHVIKHGDEHLKSRAVSLRWWEYLMLDMLATVALAAAVVGVFVAQLVTWCAGLCSSTSKHKRD